MPIRPMPDAHAQSWPVIRSTGSPATMKSVVEHLHDVPDAKSSGWAEDIATGHRARRVNRTRAAERP
ncbi:hypothetical protein [Umezawaea sp. Da 62-37]|uniref:hypothetical protein n=1 Tax=Umezawaea sp. Da 62-37 TaxID=3075927 RepID=UPI0028F709CD|nr:hypothetical protein [Umezawaea sp. Da 62-37]WNV87276.1 hypothetical protein RM788_02970 [Umezawaea sp. Da 62-37]